ncbi:MAG: rhomboid family intramembrane serine protease [Candidatus Nanohaloarchaeota archaeon QJJ-9]|nr:rhomboid family intramembrane serine protease [Candidatus Nanohaloarchaeota archaeon QJJ-9]
MERKYYAIKLSIAMIFVYLLQFLLPSLTQHLAFQASSFLTRPWTFVSSIFAHSQTDLMHLLNNLFFLALFGSILEGEVGSRRFLGAFLLTGLFANLSAFFFYPESLVLGASGAISGIVAALAIYKPRQIGLFWGVPVPMWVAFLGWIVTNLVGFGAESSIAFEAHLFGLFAGSIYGAYLRNKRERKKKSKESVDEEEIEKWEERFM